ncbi:MAG: DUF4981 domain-containing protein [Verrucomicrobiae bacterium]|nr:DUF4981 domain-containing protein [Verrucomicrobiae bacterium]MCP5532311.1 DUF4981 domain-containing protein [Akkermansiaceae bacterium]
MKIPPPRFLHASVIALVSLQQLIGGTAHADAAQPDWENEAVFRIHKEPPHATKMPFPTSQGALTKSRMESPWCRLLNGEWKYHWASEPGKRPLDFFKPDFDDTTWGTIPVPSCVELLGYGTPLYTNVTYPFKKDPPRVTGVPDDTSWTMFGERNPVSSYRRAFEAPPEWQGRQTFITFNGVSSAFYLWVNGEKVGYSQDSRTPAEFNITRYLKPGENILAVEVYRHSDGSYLESQDMWRLSGIFRDVYLWSSADLDLRDFEIDATLAEDCKTGTLAVSAWTRNASQEEAAYQIEATLADQDGRKLATLEWKGHAAAGAEVMSGGNTGGLEINPWSAENPVLYQLLITLKDATCNALAHYAQRVGFVRSEIKNGNLLVNGRPVLIKGVNRHDFTPNGGYCVPEEQMRADLDAMKRLNINTIRTAHYPNDPRFLELVDEYGFYVISEANIESHGAGYKAEETLADKPSWGPAHLDRVKNMVEMVKNHPSVIIWSLGNESGDGVNFRECAKWVHENHPDRPLHYERAGMGSQFANPGEADYIDLITPMYFPIGRLEGWCRGEEKKPRAEQRPMIQCEYNHTMGNSSGGFDEYWRIIRKERLMQGGSIWDWRDQGILQTQFAPENGYAAVAVRAPERLVNPDGSLRYFAYGGDFGDKPNDGNFCHNGIVESDLALKPHAVEIAHQYRSILSTGVDLKSSQPVVKVFNEHFFSILRNQPLRWTLRENGSPRANGELAIGNLAPQSAAEIVIPLPNLDPLPGAEYHLDLEYPQVGDKPWAKAGLIVARDQLTLEWKSAVPPAKQSPPPAPLAVEERANTLMITGPHAAIAINQRTGQVESYTVSGREQLVRPIGLNFWRPPTDNDIGAKMPKICGVWREAGPNSKVLTADHEKTANSVRATYGMAVPAGETKATVTYVFSGDGSLGVSLYLHPGGGKLPAIPSISFLCALSPELREWTWFGRGPEENYSDRHEGTFAGVWSGSVAKLWWPYSRPQETANRTGVRWSSFTDDQGRGVRIRPDDGQLLEIAAWPFLSSDLEQRKHAADLPARDLVGLRIAHRNMGVGGENSWGMWPRPHHIPQADKEYRFSFVIEPLATR